MLLRKKALLPPREKILPLLPVCRSLEAAAWKLQPGSRSPEAAARKVQPGKYADVEKNLSTIFENVPKIF